MAVSLPSGRLSYSLSTPKLKLSAGRSNSDTDHSARVKFRMAPVSGDVSTKKLFLMLKFWRSEIFQV